MNTEKKIRSIIENKMSGIFRQYSLEPPERYDDGMVLLESGLDSMGFAILVTSLEDALGYDPFTLMDEPVYPRTFGEFAGIYVQFADHASEDVLA